jgi:Domain of unknown function (DUF4136)
MRQVDTVGLLAALGAAACATTVRTHSDYDANANFAAYRTYMWRNDTPIPNQPVAERITRAVDAEMAKRGFLKAVAGGDLFVTYYAAVGRRLEMESLGYRYGPGYRTRVKEVKEGTLVVDLVDAAHNQLVWRGLATDELRPSDNPQNSQERLDDVMARMFSDYPP